MQNEDPKSPMNDFNNAFYSLICRHNELSTRVVTDATKSPHTVQSGCVYIYLVQLINRKHPLNIITTNDDTRIMMVDRVG